jgi:hypothetical protein
MHHCHYCHHNNFIQTKENKKQNLTIATTTTTMTKFECNKNTKMEFSFLMKVLKQKLACDYNPSRILQAPL